VGLFSFRFSWWASKITSLWSRLGNGRSGSSNRKSVFNFMLVMNNITLILSFPVLELITCFLLKELSYPIPREIWGRCFWTRSPMLGLRGARTLTRVIVFGVTQPIRPRYINVSDKPTDRHTDDLRHWHRALHYMHRAEKKSIDRSISYGRSPRTTCSSHGTISIFISEIDWLVVSAKLEFFRAFTWSLALLRSLID